MNSRQRLIELGRGRSDWHELNLAVQAGKQFLRSYPMASDQTVTWWARRNERFVERIFTGKNRDGMYKILEA